MDYKQLVDNQRAFFERKETRNYEYRYQALRKLKEVIVKYEIDIQKALKDDLNKSEFESYLTEIGVIILEINLTMKRLRKWMKPKKIKTPLHLFKAKSYLLHEPYGVVLIMSPWNYPFQLAIAPLIGVIAAGNTAVIKTSPDAPNTSAIIKKMIHEIYLICFRKLPLQSIKWEMNETHISSLNYL